MWQGRVHRSLTLETGGHFVGGTRLGAFHYADHNLKGKANKMPEWYIVGKGLCAFPKIKA